MAKIGLSIAGILLILYGLIELFPIVTLKKGESSSFHNNVKFIFEPLQKNKEVVYVLGGVIGLLRIIGGIGLLMNLMWAFILVIILCTVTFSMMTTYLPAGIFDGLISGIILIILLISYFGNNPIIL